MSVALIVFAIPNAPWRNPGSNCSAKPIASTKTKAIVAIWALDERSHILDRVGNVAIRVHHTERSINRHKLFLLLLVFPVKTGTQEAHVIPDVRPKEPALQPAQDERPSLD